MATTQLTKPVVKLTAGTNKIEGTFPYAFLHWISKSAVAGDDLLVVDADGDTVWEEVADGANYSKQFALKMPVEDLEISVIDSGNLYAIRQARDVPTMYDH
jgi:hypothetical protein